MWTSRGRECCKDLGRVRASLPSKPGAAQATVGLMESWALSRTSMAMPEMMDVRQLGNRAHCRDDHAGKILITSATGIKKLVTANGGAYLRSNRLNIL